MKVAAFKVIFYVTWLLLFPFSVRPAVMRGEFTCSTMRFIPICSNVGWTSVSFPNFRNHRTQAEAQRELRDFLPLINNNCSNAIVHFLCSIYAPYCDTDYPQLRLRTCKELCQHVRNDCEDNLNSFGYSWPEHLNCNNSTLFPLNASGLNFCPTDIHALTIPSIPWVLWLHIIVNYYNCNSYWISVVLHMRSTVP